MKWKTGIMNFIKANAQMKHIVYPEVELFKEFNYLGVKGTTKVQITIKDLVFYIRDKFFLCFIKLSLFLKIKLN